jgi:ABC-type spermidine/putrescine transport system permease subunit II
VATLAASALCLTEVGASLRVDTPGWQPFTQVLFNQMHYGADNNMAALCVLLLGCLTLLGLVVGIVKRWVPRTRSAST